MTTRQGPKISIITACYNSERTIEQTIQSVLNQTYNNIEYLIIDGGSTDGTMNVVNKYRDKIDVIVSEKDNGVYDAFNKGIALASGDYINFMNADDYFSNNHIVEDIANQLFNNEKIMMLHGDVRAFDDRTGHWHFRGESLTLADFEKGKMCPHQSVFTHKKLFEEYGGFDLKYKILADVDFTIKCVKKYEENIRYFPFEVAHFRLGGLSSSLQHEKQMHYENAVIHFNHFGSIPDYTKKIIDNFESHHFNQSYRQWLENLLLDNQSFLENITDLRYKDIAIFGTKKNATYLYHALKKESIDVVCFLDNDEKMHHEILHNKPIISPSKMNDKSISTVIISIERYSASQSIKQQLQHQFPNIDVYTWHELV